MSVCAADIYDSIDIIQRLKEAAYLHVLWHWPLQAYEGYLSGKYTPKGACPSAKYSKSHEHVYCGAQGALHERLHVTPLPPPARVFLLELSVCTVCGALSVCVGEKCCCAGWRGKGITRLVFVQCTGLSWLACTYTLTHKNRGLLWTPRPSWSGHYSNSLSPFCSQALAFSLSSSLFIHTFHFLPHGLKPWFCFSFSFWHCVSLPLSCFEPF